MPQCMNRRYRVTLGVLQLTVDTGGRPHKASITTVQRSCFSKKAIRSLRRTLRLSSAFPASLTPWIWKTDLEVSRPIMLEPFPLALAHGVGSNSLFSRASSPVRVFRRERDLL